MHANHAAAVDTGLKRGPPGDSPGQRVGLHGQPDRVDQYPVPAVAPRQQGEPRLRQRVEQRGILANPLCGSGDLA